MKHCQRHGPEKDPYCVDCWKDERERDAICPSDSTACYACGSHAEAVFSRIVPMGYHCPECGASDRATVACVWEKSSYDGRRYCYCKDDLMATCDYRQDVEGMPGMCVHNLDKSQPKGSPAEITDFCFHAQARSYSRHNSHAHPPDRAG